MAENMGKELAWDSELNTDGQEFVILPAGDYPFRVTKMERCRTKGSEKMVASPMARLTIEVGDAEQQTYVEHNLVLNEKVMFRLSEFFRSIGQKQHGKTVKMDWGQVIGSTGRCKVGIRKWTGKDGKEFESNEITKFYDPPEAGEKAAEKSGDDLAF